MFRTALRSLSRSPAFTLTAIAALALGIGVNTAIFSALDATLLRPSHIDDPSRIAVIVADYPRRNVTAADAAIGELIEARAATHLFSHVAVLRWSNFSYVPAGGGAAERLVGASVSPAWFDTFGARPLLGRVFRADEEQPGRHQVVILSFGLWQRLFGAERGAVGQRMVLDGESCEIVGVMPAAFRFPQSADLWQPMALRPGFLGSQSRLAGGYPMYVRLQPGVTRARAQSELQAMVDRGFHPREAQLAREMGRRVRAISHLEALASRGAVKPAPLIGAVAFVLLIACANVAGMVLARGAARSREMAVRVALGAGRWQLMRPLLGESFAIAAAGAAGGIAFGWALLRVIAAFAPPADLPERFLRFDGVALAFACAAGAVSALLFGLLPAWQVAGLASSLTSRGGAVSSRHRARSLLVAGEVALALVMLVGAGLFLRGLRNMILVDPGFDTRGLIGAELQLRSAGPERDIATLRAMVERLRAAPGVTHAAIASALPLVANDSRYPFRIPGRDHASDPFHESGAIAGMARRISPDYFGAVGVKLLAGRAFTGADVPGGEPVAVVDAGLATRYFGGATAALDQSLQLGRRSVRIVGVAAPVRQLQPGAAVERPLFYLPIFADPIPYAAFLVRGTGDLGAAIRESVRAVDPGLAVYNAQPLEERLGILLAPQRIAAWLLAFFAASALFLAAVGLYGVISYAVTQRTQEIGVRMALGAQARDVAGMVLGQGLRLALAGAALGLPGGILLSRALARQLFQVGVFDALAFSGAAALLLAVAALASWLPARRAARVDPLVALRRE